MDVAAACSEVMQMVDFTLYMTGFKIFVVYHSTSGKPD